ncbi:hypothetical protein [Caldimonas tepidiphila]|uniref:hypothetical protein n=1 Tax=Caldimonas tepidiphila TaxID=2315841 RepID=UPI000E5B6DAC|nr:hypothetical protein [Caldimonas tepidiphila]
MFSVVRVLVMLLLVASAACFGLYLFTREPRWLRLGLVITKWTVIAGLVFFGVLIVEQSFSGA